MFQKFSYCFNGKKFADQSTMHGLRELYYSKSVFWKCVWFFIIAASIGMTIYQISSSILQYRDQPTVTTIQPLIGEKVFYPSLSFCYEHWSSWVDFRKVSNLNITKQEFVFGLSYLDKMFSEDHFDLEAAQKSFEKVMEKNNFTTLFQFYKAIASDMPRHLVDIEPVNLKEKIFNEIMIYGDTCQFCYTISSQEISNNSKNMFSYAQQATLKQLTMRVEKNTLPKFGQYLTKREYKEYYLRRLLKTEDLTLNNVTLDPLRLYFPAFLYVNVNFRFELSPDMDMYSIILSGHFRKSKNRQDAPCIEGEKTNVRNVSCFENCWHLSFKKYCKRFVFFFMVQKGMDTPSLMCQRDISFQEYTSSEYRTPLKEELLSNCGCNIAILIDYDNTPLECIKTCTTGCNRWEFDVFMTSSNDPSSQKQIASRKYTFIEIWYPTEEGILVYSEINSQTWESFIADIGGLLGIWLGASIVTFLQTIYLCFYSKQEDETTLNGIIINKTTDRKL